MYLCSHFRCHYLDRFRDQDYFQGLSPDHRHLAGLVPRDYPEPSTFGNIGAVRVAGLESSLRVRPAKGFTIGLVYTNIFTRVTDDGNLDNLFFQVGKPLLRRPRHTFSVVANYTRNRLNINLNGYYSHWRDDSRFTYEFPFLFQSERVPNSDYFVLNLAASYDLVRD